MDLVQLRYFLTVADCGSFTQAAADLQMAQPTLSRQVRLLEVELRQHVFRRHGRGVVPTEAGQVLMRHARHILQQVDLAHEELERTRGASAGHVAVGLPSSLSKLVAAQLLETFAERLPEVQLSISDGLSRSMHEWLLRGRLDIALLFQPPPSPDVQLATLTRAPLCAIGAAGESDAPDAPITLSELADQQLVLPRSPHEIRLLLEREAAYAGLALHIVSEVDNIPALLDLVACGPRLTVLPRYVVPIYADPVTYSVRPIVEPPLASHVAIAVSARRPQTPTLEAARAIVAQVCLAALKRADQ